MAIDHDARTSIEAIDTLRVHDRPKTQSASHIDAPIGLGASRREPGIHGCEDDEDAESKWCMDTLFDWTETELTSRGTVSDLQIHTVEDLAKRTPCQGDINSMVYLHRLLDRLRPARLTDQDLDHILVIVQRRCTEMDVGSWISLCEGASYVERPWGFLSCTLVTA
ncbi:hypothetical protein N7492_008132 [Penicillium capsulatum]|uniref:Uncharacterized protein n=1 Tax=Penicillium capsulatum TaxID=69766 RepID=A0A9W9HUM2_9EURO|nr:hypothetical protein N7492_008132 [Penicillium capsulatum]KAJ6105543.1 hypothetical protein N7512_009060 [Penicillium capsulatum]